MKWRDGRRGRGRGRGPEESRVEQEEEAERKSSLASRQRVERDGREGGFQGVQRQAGSSTRAGGREGGDGSLPPVR